MALPQVGGLHHRYGEGLAEATNDGPPKEPKSSVLRVASARTLEICLRTVLRCTRVPARISFTRLEQVHELLEVRGTTSPMGCTEYSVGTGLPKI